MLSSSAAATSNRSTASQPGPLPPHPFPSHPTHPPHIAHSPPSLTSNVQHDLQNSNQIVPRPLHPNNNPYAIPQHGTSVNGESLVASLR